MKVGLFADKNAEKEAEAAGETVPVVTPPQLPRAGPIVALGNAVDAGYRRCCCGCSSRTGAVIIGTLTLIHGLLVLYMSLASIEVFHGRGRSIAAFVLMVLFGMVHVTTGMGLIYGADRGRSKLVSMWLYVHYAELGLYLGYCSITVGQLIYMGVATEMILGVIATCILGSCFLGYCISVVRRFYHQLLAAQTILTVKETV